MLALIALFAWTSALSQTVVTDDLGRSLTFDRTPTRIVSLAPSITETLFALGAGERIVGVTDYCDYPEEARSKEKVGGLVNPSIEKILSLKPDLIIMTTEGNLKDDFNHLEEFGILLFVTNPRTLNGIYKSITDLGLLTGETGHAGTIVGRMQSRVDSIRALHTRRKKAMLAVSLLPLMAVGRGTFLAEVLDLAGGENIAASTGLTYPTLSREAVLASDPEVLVLPSDIFLPQEDLLRLYPEWKDLRAVKNGKVFSVDSDLISRPGPRVIDGLEALNRLFR